MQYAKVLYSNFYTVGGRKLLRLRFCFNWAGARLHSSDSRWHGDRCNERQNETSAQKSLKKKKHFLLILRSPERLLCRLKSLCCGNLIQLGGLNSKVDLLVELGAGGQALSPLPFLWTKWKIPESDLIKHKGTTQNRRSLKIFPFVYLIQVLTCMLQSSSWGKPENWRATNLERTFDISPPFALPSRIEWWNGNYPSIVILMMFQQLTWMQADPPTKPRDLLVQDCSPAILL